MGKYKTNRRKDPRDLLIGEMYGTPTENREMSAEECNEMYNQNPEEWAQVFDTIEKEYEGVPCKMDLATRKQNHPFTKAIVAANERARMLSDIRRKETGIVLL